MPSHSFDSSIASLVGVNAAVLYQNLVYWVEHNATNNRNYHEGRYWTYNSYEAFSQQFEYLSEKQIRTAMKKLVDEELVKVGNFNKNPYDKTNWYSVDIPNCPNRQMEEAQKEISTNDQSGNSNREANNKPIQKPLTRENALNEEEFLIFEKIWEAYPEDRKRGKPACKQAFVEALKEGIEPKEILEAVVAYAEYSKGFTRSKVKFSDNWFRTDGWETPLAQAKIDEEARQKALGKAHQTTAEWIKTGSSLCRHISAKEAQTVLGLGLVSRDQIKAAGVQL